MKALSLDQPWASAIAAGLKRIETRGKRISHRGPIAIHGTLRADLEIRSAFEIRQDEAVRAAFAAIGITNFEDLPFGAVVATAELVDCVPSEELRKTITSAEAIWGNYGPKRYGYVLANIVRLERPVQCRGYQYLWDWEEAVAL